MPSKIEKRSCNANETIPQTGVIVVIRNFRCIKRRRQMHKLSHSIVLLKCKRLLADCLLVLWWEPLHMLPVVLFMHRYMLSLAGGIAGKLYSTSSNSLLVGLFALQGHHKYGDF